MTHQSTQLTDVLDLGADLRAEDLALLGKISEGLDLLADISHADLLIYLKAGDHVLAFAQGRPTSVPSQHLDSLVGRTFSQQEVPVIHRALFSGRMVHGVKGRLIRGAPTLLETFPIRSSRGYLMGVLTIEMNLIEYERSRKRNSIFREALTRLFEEAAAGRLEGASGVGRLGEHYATLIIDSSARILYMSSLAEKLYRKLGYTTSLLGRRLSELDTTEHICYKAMERARCLEQRIEEHNLIWMKRVIPLPPAPRRRSLLWRLLGRNHRIGGALIVVEDVTEEHRKEQALRIKSALIREIHHRVKNNLQTIAALLRMQARRTGSPEVLDMLKQSINRILSIALVHEFLSKEESPEESSYISIREVTQRILSEVMQGILDPAKSIRMSLEGGDFSLPSQQATSCALVISELLQNAVEHGFEVKNEGTIQVALRHDDDQMIIEVVDSGQGLPPGFDIEKDGSLGLQIIRTLVREDLKGEFAIVDANGVSARVTFPYPLREGEHPQG